MFPALLTCWDGVQCMYRGCMLILEGNTAGRGVAGQDLMVCGILRRHGQWRREDAIVTPGKLDCLNLLSKQIIIL